VLGGWLTEYLSWRWVFWINLPLGLVALWAIRRALAGLPVQRREAQVDYLGAVLMISALAACCWASPWSARATPGPTRPCWRCWAAPCWAWLFIAHERRCPEPLLPLSLFGNRVAVLCWA
jgi:MFS family permease